MICAFMLSRSRFALSIASLLGLFFGLLPVSSFASPGEDAASHASRSATQPPTHYGVRLEQQWIPMPDGVRLAATLYLPDGAKPGEKFPALLEYLPYRKDDATAARDYPIHSYCARRGSVSVRVDIRGCEYVMPRSPSGRPLATAGSN